MTFNGHLKYWNLPEGQYLKQ